jgi:hypothetical protein
MGCFGPVLIEFPSVEGKVAHWADRSETEYRLPHEVDAKLLMCKRSGVNPEHTHTHTQTRWEYEYFCAMEILYHKQAIKRLFEILRSKRRMTPNLVHINKLINDPVIMAQMEFQLVMGRFLSHAGGWIAGRDDQAVYERCVEAAEAGDLPSDSSGSDLEEPEPDMKDDYKADPEIKNDSEKPEPLTNGFRSHEMLDQVRRWCDELNEMLRQLLAAMGGSYHPEVPSPLLWPQVVPASAPPVPEPPAAEPEVVDPPVLGAKQKKSKPLSLQEKIHRYGNQVTLEVALARAYHNLTRDQFLKVVRGFHKCVEAQISTHTKWLDCWRIFPWLTFAAAGSKGSAFMRAFLTHFKTLFSAEQSERIERKGLNPDVGASGDDQRHFQQLMAESHQKMNKDDSRDDLRSTPTIGLLDALLQDGALFKDALKFAANNLGRISNRRPTLYNWSMPRLITLIHQMTGEGLFNKVPLLYSPVLPAHMVMVSSILSQLFYTFSIISGRMLV